MQGLPPAHQEMKMAPFSSLSSLYVFSNSLTE